MLEDNNAKEKDTGQQEAPKLLDEPIKMKEIVYMMILSLEGKAWAYLDKVAHPETQKHLKDAGEAKVAIDAIDALYKVIEPVLEQADKKDIQVRLANLRLNFAKD
ncbi:MAG: DUF1844 domain-containing protein [candidate division WOR-3 bacterium]|nr:DUF1844 domain-containing protein [candidate division WOR-3 bacterium]